MGRVNVQQYVFRETSDELKFVGDFDGLYRNVADPWEQSGNVEPMASYYRLSRQRLVTCFNNTWFDFGLEVGCGHGYVTSMLNNSTRIDWEGMDISRIAVEIARFRSPGILFHVGDIANPNGPTINKRYDVVVLSQILWYVLEQFDEVMRNCYDLLVPGGTVLITQAFLRGEQRYGREIALGFKGAVQLLKKYDPPFTLKVKDSCDYPNICHIDGLLALQREN